MPSIHVIKTPHTCATLNNVIIKHNIYLLYIYVLSRISTDVSALIHEYTNIFDNN